MNKSSRGNNALKNILVAVLCQCITFLFSFATRTLFIKLLGDEYNGLTSFFQNVVAMLSFTELGVGTAIVYSLYKPINDNDIIQLKSLMDFYKKIYRVIAATVFSLGILITPFLEFFLETDAEQSDLWLYFTIYLANTAVSYLFIYKSSILNADQRNRIVKFITTVFQILKCIIEIGVLYLTESFVAYLTVQLICTVLCNLTISAIANKYYPWLKERAEALSSVDKKRIFGDVRSMFIYRVGGILINNSSSIIMSKLVGVVILGYYSNYLLFVGAMTTMLELVFSALTGSLGNLNSCKDINSSEKVFRECNFVALCIYTVCAVGIFIVLDDIIFLWLGAERVLGKTVVFAIASNVYVYGMLSGVMAYRNTTELFRKTKYIILITSILNIVISIVLGIWIGLPGIIIAPTLARLISNFWYEPLILYKKIFTLPAKRYFIRLLRYFLTTFLSGTATYIVVDSVFKEITIMNILMKVILSVAIPILVIIISNIKTQELIGTKERVCNALKMICHKG